MRNTNTKINYNFHTVLIKNSIDTHERIFETFQISLSKYQMKRKQQKISQLYGYWSRQSVWKHNGIRYLKSGKSVDHKDISTRFVWVYYLHANNYKSGDKKRLRYYIRPT